MSQSTPAEHNTMGPDISRERLKEMWCELNRFQVPAEIPGMAQKDMWGAMLLIAAFIPHRELLETWNKPRASLPEGQSLNERVEDDSSNSKPPWPKGVLR